MVQSLNVVEQTSMMMITLAGPAHQRQMWTQHKWRKWFSKIDEPQLEICLLAWGLSIWNVHNFVHKELEYCKVCAKSVPNCLVEGHKNRHFEIAPSHLQQFKEEGNGCLGSTVTEDEKGMHNFTPQPKQLWIQWEHPTSPRVKTCKVCLPECWQFMHLYSAIQESSTLVGSTPCLLSSFCYCFKLRFDPLVLTQLPCVPRTSFASYHAVKYSAVDFPFWYINWFPC
jgi:hypothetical protein